jgi:hypothetical protein
MQTEYQYQLEKNQIISELENLKLNTNLREVSNSPAVRNDVNDEAATIRSRNNFLIRVVRQLCLISLGQVTFDVVDSHSSKLQIDFSRFKVLDFFHIYLLLFTRLREQMTSLVAEVSHCRMMNDRLAIFRADLRYQKAYLSLKLDDLM